MAEVLGVDLGTVQGWESGRRPLAHMKAGALVGLRRRLAVLGAEPNVVGLLDAAMDADRIVGAALDPPEVTELHPLASWVHTRDTAHMLAWAIVGTPPPALTGRIPPPRRGPVAAAPLLAAGDRAAFFTHLRETVEAARRPGGGALLHRQALYLTSYDRGPDAASWTASALHARRGVLARRGWSEHWAEARSTATALARLGDPQPLLDFIERSLAGDDTAEAANLNYWAYWLGALGDPQADDLFMRDRELSGWDPAVLLRRFGQGLVIRAPGYLDLYVHSLWALLTAHPWLPQAYRPMAAVLAERTGQLLDGGGISERSRRELTDVHYVLDDRYH
ncbi:XRE family transcriptional regulator [Streptomyces sp. P9(2023)]|uniref:XRE family transcriptional regulator n=1 Tax=Streptomyces sp. P9(2023) TaxID=3064394 RepID=UPI0028F44CD7|nr:XRE family transcriptional regulator [Streptomyces sp. P9(2023)]MDT9692611.1 XRE family transcriptional regulator [Streptomyces sp. P9(2023)]